MMGWLENDERRMRQEDDRTCAHEPPLGTQHPPYHCGWDGCDCESMMPPEQPCGDCGWPLEGGFVLCDAHKGDK